MLASTSASGVQVSTKTFTTRTVEFEYSTPALNRSRRARVPQRARAQCE
jgi:hypothetical protein